MINIKSLRERLIGILYKAAISSKRTRILLTPVGLIFFFSLLILLIIVSLELDDVLRFPPLIAEPLNLTISIPIIFIGLSLTGWSVHHFIKAKGTPVPLNPPSKLVTSGPYKHVRNPMLTGLFILFFGLGILLKSISLTFIFTPFFILFNVLELKLIEEPELKKRFGTQYVEYKKRVPMFIPRLKRKDPKKTV